MRKEVEDVMCEELREELYPEMRKINPEQNKKDILIEAGTDPDLELGGFRIEYRMKRPAPGEHKPTAAARPKPAPPPAAASSADDNDMMATVIEQPAVAAPSADDMATIIQAPAGADSFSITVKSENGENTHKFTKKKISIGRATQDDVVLESADFSISRGHALLELRDGKFFLTPVGVNGTRLNGEELALKTEVEVNRGDEIKIMSYTLTIS
jgi:predicted component of type VI protein secretion system